MGKTNFVDGNPQQGVQGTIVNAAWLNKVFGPSGHRHDGKDADGSAAIDYAADTGAANAYVIALTPALTSHVVGMPIHFMAANANTGASTININGLGIKTISKNFDQPLASGDIKAGKIITVVWDGVDYQMLSQTKSETASQILHVRDEKATGTNGGANVSGSQARVFNTVVLNEITGASLGANQVILPAGTYKFSGRCPTYGVDKHQCGLWNVTDAGYTKIGKTGWNAAATTVNDDSIVFGKFTIAAQKVFELRQYTLTVHAVGLGYASFTVNGLGIEVFSELIIEKIS